MRLNNNRWQIIRERGIIKVTKITFQDKLHMIKVKKKKYMIFSGITRLIFECRVHVLCYFDTGQAAEQ